jgi:hypothetical protein
MQIETPTKPIISAFMTASRYESVWARTMITQAFALAGIPLFISGGVFYGQCMQRMFEDAIAQGVEIAFTVDSDSCFNAGHLGRLLSVLVSDDKYDAVAAMQMKRGKKLPLFTMGGQTEAQ